MPRFFFRTLKIFLSIVLLLTILVALLPSIADTETGKNRLLRYLNHRIPGEVRIRSLHIGWFSGQQIEGFTLDDPEKNRVITIESIASSSPLWKLLLKRTDVTSIRIAGLNASIGTDREGATNIERATGYSIGQIMPLSGASIIALKGVNASVQFSDLDSNGSLLASGTTDQNGTTGSFNFDFAFDYSEDRIRFSRMDARISNFPVGFIDLFVGLKNPEYAGIFRSLLGDVLNIVAKKTPPETGQSFSVTASSPSLKGTFSFAIEKDFLVFTAPGSVGLQLVPDRINPFLQLFRLRLLNPGEVNVLFSSLKIPTGPFHSENPSCASEISCKIAGSGIRLDHDTLGSITIDDSDIQIDAPACSNQVSIRISANAKKENEPFTFRIQTTFDKPLDFSSLGKPFPKNVKIDSNIDRIPIGFIPTFAQHPDFLLYTGTTATIQTSFQMTDSNDGELGFSLHSPGVVIENARLKIESSGSSIKLASPVDIQWLLAPNCLKKNHRKTEVCPVRVKINRFLLSRNPSQAGKLEFEAAIPDVSVPFSFPIENVKVHDLTVKIAGNPEIFTSSLRGALSLVSNDGNYSPLLAGSVALLAEATFETDRSGSTGISKAKIQLNGNEASAEIEGRYEDGTLTLTKPALLSYPLTPDAQKFIISLSGKEFPEIENTAHISLRVEPAAFRLSGRTPLSLIRAKGVLSVDRIRLKDPSEKLPILEEIELPWAIDGPENRFSMNLDGHAYARSGSKPGDLEASIQVSDWLQNGLYDPSSATIETQADLSNLPTSLISALLLDQDISSLIGPLLDIDFNSFVDMRKRTPGFVDMNLDAARFHLKGRFKIDDSLSLFSSSKPATIRLEMTPGGWAFLKDKVSSSNAPELLSPFTISGHLLQFDFPLTFTNKKGFLEAKLKTSTIEWNREHSLPFRLKSTIKSENLNDRIDLICEANAADDSPLTIQATVHEFLNPNGQINDSSNLGIDANVSGEKITPEFIRSLFFLPAETGSYFKELFGDSLHLYFDCRLKKLTGPVEGFIRGRQGAGELRGRLTSGDLLLDAPFESQVTLTPGLSRLLFMKNMSFLASAYAGSETIKLTFYPENFFCPLFPFDLNRLTVGRGKADLGKIRFRSEGELARILGFISPLKEDFFEIWFTPLFFSIKKGKLKQERVDFLVNQAYPLALWGNIDLSNHEGELVMGIPPFTLNTAFGVKGLQSDYMLPVLLEIKNGKIKLDKNDLIGQVSALMIRLKGGSHAQMIGGLIDLLKTSSKESSIPSPTTTPFPWPSSFSSVPVRSESQNDASDAIPSKNSPEEKKDHRTGEKQKKKKKKKSFLQKLGSEKVLKNLEEEAGRALDKWLGNE